MFYEKFTLDICSASSEVVHNNSDSDDSGEL